jgi:predicted small integral membrane protein
MLAWMHWTIPSAIGFGALFGMLAVLGILDKYHPGYARKGFLPMTTTRGDRVFLSAVSLLAVVFLWLKFLPEVALWGALAIAAAVISVLMKWG